MAKVRREEDRDERRKIKLSATQMAADGSRISLFSESDKSVRPRLLLHLLLFLLYMPLCGTDTECALQSTTSSHNSSRGRYITGSSTLRAAANVREKLSKPTHSSGGLLNHRV